MVKYRLLNQEELQSLEKEFVDFLVLNGITASDWVGLKEDKEKSARFIELFSDVVFEKILRQVQYLDRYSKSSIFTFKCDAEEILLIGVETKDSSIDFTHPAHINRLKTTPPADLKIYRSSKKYQPDREMELFKMMRNGCTKSDGEHYGLLDQVINSMHK